MSKFIFYKQQRAFSFLFICTSIFVLSCKEQDSYPLGSDSNASLSPVSDVNVQNIPGGAIISYKLSKERELLYVEAVYETNDGKIKRVRKQSYFTDKIKVDGFLDTSAHIIQLFTVSRGENPTKSEPVEVTIHPLQSPLVTVYKSIEITQAFGGLYVKFQNPDTARVAIIILSKDSLTGEFTPMFRKYTKAEGGDFKITGLDSVMQKFGYYVRNEFNDLSDTTFMDIKPLYEEKIDPQYFQEPNPLFPSGNYISEGPGTWTFSDMWDGKATNSSPYYMWISSFTTFPTWFAIDLGQVVKLSRIEYHGRPAYNFTSRYPKIVEFWGSLNPKIDPEHPFDSWTLLGHYDTEDNLPEGLKQPTAEIINAPYSENGIDFSINDVASKPNIRYVRMKIISNWGGVNRFVVGDLSFYGKVIKTHDEIK